MKHNDVLFLFPNFNCYWNGGKGSRQWTPIFQLLAVAAYGKLFLLSWVKMVKNLWDTDIVNTGTKQVVEKRFLQTSRESFIQAETLDTTVQFFLVFLPVVVTALSKKLQLMNFFTWNSQRQEYQWVFYEQTTIGLREHRGALFVLKLLVQYPIVSATACMYPLIPWKTIPLTCPTYGTGTPESVSGAMAQSYRWCFAMSICPGLGYMITKHQHKAPGGL